MIIVQLFLHSSHFYDVSIEEQKISITLWLRRCEYAQGALLQRQRQHNVPLILVLSLTTTLYVALDVFVLSHTKKVHKFLDDVLNIHTSNKIPLHLLSLSSLICYSRLISSICLLSQALSEENHIFTTIECVWGSIFFLHLKPSAPSILPSRKSTTKNPIVPQLISTIRGQNASI